MRTTQRKGDTACTQAIATFTRMGYDVAIPVTESAPYDLLVDSGTEVYKVQCRYHGAKVPDVPLRKVHSNSGGYVVKRPVCGSYDLLYVLRDDNREYLLVRCVHGQSSVRLKDSDLLDAEVKLVKPCLGEPAIGAVHRLESGWGESP